MKQSVKFKLRVLFALLLMATMTQMTCGASTYTVTSTGNKFKVTRSDSSTVETVRYRTIGWNAIAGKHFTAKSDTLNFDEGVGTRYVTVNEPTVSSIDPKYRYQTTTTRLYRFQVLDLNGFLLAQTSRSISMGSGHQINTTKIFTTEDLSPTSLHSTTNPIVVTDEGYAQDYHSFPISNFFSNHVPREYISIMDAHLIMLIEMEVAESDDGYQYIQVLVDDETHVDTGAGGGDPGGTNYSIFKAGFGHKPGKKYTTYEKYCFPAPNCYNLIKDEDRCYPWKYDPYNNPEGYIYRQFFKTVGTDYNYYVSFYDEGWIELPIDLQTVGVRLDASGDFGDTWYAKNLTAKVRAWDNRSPYVIPGDIVVSPGPYNKDNTFYVQIPMNEIVVVTGNPTLQTTWGELTYAYGTGSNVLTFSGKITANAGTQLKLNYIDTPSGVSIKGLNGYTYDDLEEKTFNYYSTEDYVLNNDNVEITKHFTEPLIDNGVNKPVAFTVKWRTKTLTEGVDYTLSYRNNYGPQSETTEGTVEVNGIGKYSGTATGTFTIRAVEISDFTEIEPNVYQIANRDDLMHLSGYVSNGKHNCGGLTFLQTANIDVDGEFLPIGGNSRTRPEFTGTYDGQGYTISGIDAHPDPYSVDSRHWIGLFGHLANKNGNQGTLKNIVLANSTFTGFEDVGAIAARNFSSVITNCRVESNVIVNKYVSNADQHGGIVGNNDFGRIEGCVSAAVLNCNKRVGGLVGNITGGLISNNLYTGTSVISGNNVGALIGQRYTGLNNPTLSNNYYVDSNQPGGFNGSDVDGARFGRTITLAPNIAIVGDTVEYDVSGLTAIGNSVLIHGDTIYSGFGQTVTVAPAHGADYRVSNVVVMNGNTPVDVTQVEDEDGIFSFVMPAGDVSITYELQPRYTFDSETGVLALLWGEFNKDNKWDDVEPAAVTSVTATGDVSFTGNCLNLFRDFTNCTNMDLGLVNTDSMTIATNMFYGCEKLETLDVSGWNTSNVTTMYQMFYNCFKLDSLDVSGWNTANVSSMAYMFRSCKNLSKLDVSGWNTANVNDMSFMFYCCNKLDSLDVSGWDTASVTDIHSMFNSCSRLGTLDVSGWNTAKVADMSYMFYNCSSLTKLDVSGWNTAEVTKMYCMFEGCSGLDTLDVSGWNTAKVTKMYSMFQGCSGFDTLDLSGWNTAKVTDMSYMFYNCGKLETLYLSGWNTDKVTDILRMFYGCAKLATIYVGRAWSTESVSSTAGFDVFNGCISLVGGKGTTYDPQHVGYDYAHIDGGLSNPGYLTEFIIPGDVNSDGIVNVNDITATVAKSLGGNPQPFNVEAADLDHDGVIGVTDVTALIRIVLSE